MYNIKPKKARGRHLSSDFVKVKAGILSPFDSSTDPATASLRVLEALQRASGHNIYTVQPR